MKKRVTVIGAGLAGSEAALQIARLGIPVRLYEMRPVSSTPAHKTDRFAELVCSNSFRSKELTRAAGVLKAELNVLGSYLLEAAFKTQVPAGSSLAVDRERFSSLVTSQINRNPLIEVVREEVREIPPERPLIIASGPLTSQELFNSLQNFIGDARLLHFFDAVSPLVYAESIDMEHAFFGSRYGKGGQDYINCPLTEEEFDRFHTALINADKHPLEIEHEERYFEACLPVEEMARRGRETLLFGPMKPVGIIDPRTGRRPFAVVQLRKDDAAGNLYNIVGFQTNLRYSEQARVLRLIPALKKAEFARYGKMHLNTYIESPRLLNPALEARNYKGLFFAGQITGAEGYVEAIATGLLAGINAARMVLNRSLIVLPQDTLIGSLVRYLSLERDQEFQPMHASFGLLPPLDKKLPKKIRYYHYAERALKSLTGYLEKLL